MRREAWADLRRNLALTHLQQGSDRVGVEGEWHPFRQRRADHDRLRPEGNGDPAAARRRPQRHIDVPGSGPDWDRHDDAPEHDYRAVHVVHVVHDVDDRRRQGFHDHHNDDGCRQGIYDFDDIRGANVVDILTRRGAVPRRQGAGA